MRTPDFWRRSAAAPARLLAPLASLYGAVAGWRMGRRGPRAGLPTICIGGFTIGGDGKTPAALAIAGVLAGMGERPAFLTRGYGGTRIAREPFAVDLDRHGVCEAGDEPLLLARLAPTIVAADRLAGAVLAKGLAVSVLVLDDGLQSRRLQPDFALAVVDAQYGAGNGLCLPAGPLRAPLARQIEAVNAVLTIGRGAAGDAIVRLARAAGKRVFHARLEPDRQAAARLAAMRVYAFAGVARPAKFLASLREIGADVAGFRWFPDHHIFTAREIAALQREARRKGATLVATEKDAARMAAKDAAIEILPVKAVFEEPGAIEEALAQALRRSTTRAGCTKRDPNCLLIN